MHTRHWLIALFVGYWLSILLTPLTSFAETELPPSAPGDWTIGSRLGLGGFYETLANAPIPRSLRSYDLGLGLAFRERARIGGAFDLDLLTVPVTNPVTGDPSTVSIVSAVASASLNGAMFSLYKGSPTFYLSASFGAGLAVPLQNLATDFQADVWKAFPLLHVSLKFKPLGPIDGERFENPNLNSKGLGLFAFMTFRLISVSAVHKSTSSFIVGVGWDFWI